MASQVLTFLFTDIEGSTRRWEADPDAMRAALALHDTALREAITTHGGQAFKHTGDGVCAVFTSPRAAVDASVDAQRRLELPVRMGIATGEAELRDGDYFGVALNRAARVMAAGHGGQILLDGATAGLLTGVELKALGPKRLRDITRPVEVFQIRAEGLPIDFPALKAVEPAPGNLRPQRNAFVGRTTELADLQSTVNAHQVVTLTGVGGVGKTRLALELGARLADHFSDGVWIVELAAVGDPAAVPDAIAAVLGITQQPGMTLTETIAAALDGRSRLLVLDNCEHLLEATAGIVEAITARTDTVKILATSREGLRVEGEQLWPVASLGTGRGIESPAARLFIDRVQASAPGVAVSPDSAVVEICERLDGIPLAIELAASRMVSMPVSEIRDRLDDRFRLLVGSRRGLERHQTLRHAVQWSFDLLGEDEKHLLTRCSVFAGGFDVTAASAVCNLNDEYATLDLLDSLVRKSLLIADRSARRTRFSMLETIRQFAEEQLQTHGVAEETRAAHALYFASCEDLVYSLWDGPRQSEAFEWFKVELANLRTAFRWAVDHNDLDSAATIAVVASPLGNWVEQHEPNSWAAELIEPARAVRHRRLVQLYTMAAQCGLNGRIEEAVDCAEAGQAAIAEGRFDPVPLGMDAYLCNGYLFAGQFDRVIAWCRGLLARDRSQIAAKTMVVQTLAMAGATDEAVALSRELLTAIAESDNPHVKCHALFASGWAHYKSHPAIAYDLLRRALTIAQRNGNRQFESHAMTGLARLAADRGSTGEAFELFTLAIRMHHDSGSIELMRAVMACAAALLTRLGYYEPSARVIGFAETSLTRIAFPEVDTAINELCTRLGPEGYEAMTAAGAAMTPAAMATYVLDQIDLARSVCDEARSP